MEILGLLPHCLRWVSRKSSFKSNVSYNNIVGEIPGNWDENKVCLHWGPSGARPPDLQVGASEPDHQDFIHQGRCIAQAPPSMAVLRGKVRDVSGCLTPERLILALVGSVQQHYFNPVLVEESTCGQHSHQGHDGGEEDVKEHHWGDTQQL